MAEATLQNTGKRGLATTKQSPILAFAPPIQERQNHDANDRCRSLGLFSCQSELPSLSMYEPKLNGILLGLPIWMRLTGSQF